ncbi:hypothetical protein B0H10DRAFT_2032411, partial [Mycena sp. CBHHK59/15]
MPDPTMSSHLSPTDITHRAYQRSRPLTSAPPPPPIAPPRPLRRAARRSVVCKHGHPPTRCFRSHSLGCAGTRTRGSARRCGPRDGGEAGRTAYACWRRVRRLHTLSYASAGVGPRTGATSVPPALPFTPLLPDPAPSVPAIDTRPCPRALSCTDTTHRGTCYQASSSAACPCM